MKPGPNQIQREDAKRRLTIGFNVRGRDVEHVVNELEQKINEKIKFPMGYYVVYGGQFENLIEARERPGRCCAGRPDSDFCAPVRYVQFGAAGVADFYCHSTFGYCGVLALWLRDMPFSISAGVGFIALFA